MSRKTSHISRTEPLSIFYMRVFAWLEGRSIRIRFLLPSPTSKPFLRAPRDSTYRRSHGEIDGGESSPVTSSKNEGAIEAGSDDKRDRGAVGGLGYHHQKQKEGTRACLAWQRKGFITVIMTDKTQLDWYVTGWTGSSEVGGCCGFPMRGGFAHF